MIKVCFIYDGYSNEHNLKVYSKMTPNRSGIFKGIVGTANEAEADFFCVVDDTSHNIDRSRTIYMSAHPYVNSEFTAYKDTRKYNNHALAVLNSEETFGFGEWWIEHTYDELVNMQPMAKKEKLSCIMSDTNGFGRTERKEFVRRLVKRRPFPVYGRINPQGLGDCYKGQLGNYNPPTEYWQGKETVLKDSEYSIEVDHGPCKGYFSERFFDSMLMWNCPLYWGGTTVHEYMPEGSFHYIDIMGNGDDVLEYIEQPRNMEAIREGRDLLLNKYQIWGRVWEIIKNLA